MCRGAVSVEPVEPVFAEIEVTPPLRLIVWVWAGTEAVIPRCGPDPSVRCRRSRKSDNFEERTKYLSVFISFLVGMSDHKIC